MITDRTQGIRERATEAREARDRYQQRDQERRDAQAGAVFQGLLKEFLGIDTGPLPAPLYEIEGVTLIGVGNTSYDSAMSVHLAVSCVDCDATIASQRAIHDWPTLGDALADQRPTVQHYCEAAQQHDRQAALGSASRLAQALADFMTEYEIR